MRFPQRRLLVRRVKLTPPRPCCLHATFSTTAAASPDRLLAVLRGCVSPSHLSLGFQAHARAVTSGLHVTDPALQTRLIGMYVLARRFRDGVAVFSSLPPGAAASALPWNWLIRGFTMAGEYRSALLFYLKMWAHPSAPLPDSHTFPYVVKSCAALGAIALGRLVHRTARTHGLDSDMFVGSALIKMYANGGLLWDARQVFDGMAERDCVLWNVMMDGYVKAGEVSSAVGLFGDMRASESEVAVANTLVSMYAKCKCLDDAWKLFSLMPRDDLKSGIQPDPVTLVSLLPALTDLNGFKQGKEIHGYIVRNCVHMDVFLVSALVDIYFKCRAVRMAQNVYDSAKAIDVVIGSTMISGYVLNGMSQEAVKMFQYLLEQGIKPNAVVIASMLPACASMAAMKLGQELHSYALKNAYEGSCYVESALVDMSWRLDCDVFQHCDLIFC
ncbi:hypothetical protein E2562_033077 [Oryza meyeriana var. granulata]|uniref:Pentacotripeptide-repeat region of PRORP domain-containing protein n=1 Tax=Oryza meyeriana var. granulata TaxID=110450 RepID=A0A6G1DR64_9ORYZ|nr:hypothetical protein E2562_033077 [Oryza meyeriana var. granulata]